MKAIGRFFVRLLRLNRSDWWNRSEWSKASLAFKGMVLCLWTVWQQWMWQRYPRLVLTALEFDDHAICRNLGLMNLVFRMHCAPGFNRPLMSFRELCNVYLLVKDVASLPGDLAEVGVYRGGSAKIICEAKGDKMLHLFDTFNGLPEPDSSVDLLAQGEMRDTSLEEVARSLEHYPNVRFHQGLFPETAVGVGDQKFSFVHLDTDLYVSTKRSLEFFYDRMVAGGIILSHDYNSMDTPGVRKAFDEVFRDKPETIIEVWDSQCVVVKH